MRKSVPLHDHVISPYGPAGGPRPQLPPWQPPQSRYPPLPPSPPNHPTPPISSGLPSLVRSRAPSSSPHSPASSSDYNHNWFISKQEYWQWVKDKARIMQEVDQRRAEEALRYHNAGGTKPLDFDTQRNILLYLWYKLQQ
jgi:hypothetical protein